MNNNLYAKAMEAGTRLRVKSALNPILWLCALVSAPTLIANVFYSPPVAVTIIGLAPVAVAMYSFIFLLHRNPDKLQSEEFQIQKFSLEMSQQSGQTNPQTISSDATTNPAALIETKEREN